MTYYGGKEMAEAFRTVRRNTIQIAEDIPDDKYGFRAVPDVQTVAEELAHVAAATWWHRQAHAVEKKTFISFEDFSSYMGKSTELEKALTTKPQILDALRKGGEEFAQFLESMSPEQLAETVSFPPPVQPSSRTRFEMLLGGRELRHAGSADRSRQSNHLANSSDTDHAARQLALGPKFRRARSRPRARCR